MHKGSPWGREFYSWGSPENKFPYGACEHCLARDRTASRHFALVYLDSKNRRFFGFWAYVRFGVSLSLVFDSIYPIKTILTHHIIKNVELPQPRAGITCNLSILEQTQTQAERPSCCLGNGWCWWCHQESKPSQSGSELCSISSGDCCRGCSRMELHSIINMS